ncbi:Low-density lipoprotein receptor-related protein 8 [Melipona quadrifasciata]|uniref:Low-density lipoprotein receptor-related protein 8 n=1 Tax=Melipona quadrifasciata TaxID=166423 RepID=A0A0N0BH65_9HYME|nr:Low-density lipoprotein receptor-related protein 8 [Melipona quadrifasciata]
MARAPVVCNSSVEQAGGRALNLRDDVRKISTENEFECTPGFCLPVSKVCDGFMDCGNGKDEENCQHITLCRADEFQCLDGTCVSQTARCDGRSDCRDRSDETNCTVTTCSGDQFRCLDGTCISIDKRCNQNIDCRNGEDENQCAEKKCPSPTFSPYLLPVLPISLTSCAPVKGLNVHECGVWKQVAERPIFAAIRMDGASVTSCSATGWMSALMALTRGTAVIMPFTPQTLSQNALWKNIYNDKRIFRNYLEVRTRMWSRVNKLWLKRKRQVVKKYFVDDPSFEKAPRYETKYPAYPRLNSKTKNKIGKNFYKSLRSAKSMLRSLGEAKNLAESKPRKKKKKKKKKKHQREKIGLKSDSNIYENATFTSTEVPVSTASTTLVDEEKARGKKKARKGKRKKQKSKSKHSKRPINSTTLEIVSSTVSSGSPNSMGNEIPSAIQICEKIEETSTWRIFEETTLPKFEEITLEINPSTKEDDEVNSTTETVSTSVNDESVILTGTSEKLFSSTDETVKPTQTPTNWNFNERVNLIDSSEAERPNWSSEEDLDRNLNSVLKEEMTISHSMEENTSDVFRIKHSKEELAFTDETTETSSSTEINLQSTTVADDSSQNSAETSGSREEICGYRAKKDGKLAKFFHKYLERRVWSSPSPLLTKKNISDVPKIKHSSKERLGQNSETISVDETTLSDLRNSYRVTERSENSDSAETGQNSVETSGSREEIHGYRAKKGGKLAKFFHKYLEERVLSPPSPLSMKKNISDVAKIKYSSKEQLGEDQNSERIFVDEATLRNSYRTARRNENSDSAETSWNSVETSESREDIRGYKAKKDGKLARYFHKYLESTVPPILDEDDTDYNLSTKLESLLFESSSKVLIDLLSGTRLFNHKNLPSSTSAQRVLQLYNCSLTCAPCKERVSELEAKLKAALENSLRNEVKVDSGLIEETTPLARLEDDGYSDSLQDLSELSEVFSPDLNVAPTYNYLNVTESPALVETLTEADWGRDNTGWPDYSFFTKDQEEGQVQQSDMYSKVDDSTVSTSFSVSALPGKNEESSTKRLRADQNFEEDDEEDIIETTSTADSNETRTTTDNWWQTSNDDLAKCDPDQFLCNDGTCIGLYLACNGYSDCPDDSDELDCRGNTIEDYENGIDGSEGNSSCSRWEFACDGSCISNSFVCDNVRHCKDGLDEEDCGIEEKEGARGDRFDETRGCLFLPIWPRALLWTSPAATALAYRRALFAMDSTTAPGQKTSFTAFKCVTGNKCIEGVYRCDGHPDCPDHSDEDCANETITHVTPPISQPWPGWATESPRKCDPSKEMRCDNGQCVLLRRKCDNIFDCFDGSDERGCASLPLVVELLLVSQGVCTPAEWKCASGECIAEIERCDNVTHCADGSDEFGCECPDGQLPCDNGICIMKNFFCDNNVDCHDGSDERGCNNVVTPPAGCRADEFTCRDGTCISQSAVCDRRPDCPHEDDETNCLQGRPSLAQTWWERLQGPAVPNVHPGEIQTGSLRNILRDFKIQICCSD